MVKVLPPHSPRLPHAQPGMAISVAPAGHCLWLDDYEYYDQLGRDPLQKNEIWGIKDAGERVERLKEVLEEYPKSKHRREILCKAAFRGDDAIVRCMVETGLEVSPNIMQARKDKEKMDEEAQKMVEDGEIMDRVDPDIAPLHIAAFNGKLECVKIMVESGVDVDALDDCGRTPFIFASQSSELGVMRYLLEKGANPKAHVDDSLEESQKLGERANANALEMAALNKNIEALQLLLDHGLKPTPLAIKEAAGTQWSCLKLLMEHAGYPMEDKDGKKKADLINAEQKKCIVDATEKAVDSGDLESMKFLLSYQHPVDANGELLPFEIPESQRREWTYGTYDCVMRDRIEKFDYMKSFGVKEHDTMSLDEVPEGQLFNIQHLLDKAVTTGSLNCVKHLVENYGADPDAHRMPPGTKPLWNAAMYNRAEVVRYLLQTGRVNIHAGNGRYSTGPTALWTAITTKSLESIELLLEHGGPVDELDEDVLKIMEPTTAILRSEMGDKENRPTLHLQLESSAEKYISDARGSYTDLNPKYVRLEIGPEDMFWIENLQIRKRDSLLKETGKGARELNAAQATPRSQLDDKDPRQLVPAFPIVEEITDTLESIDDLAPKFQPFMVPVKHGKSDQDEFF